MKDVDFATNQIVIRDGKGRKDRVTMLPAAVKTILMTHIDHVRAQHEADLPKARRPTSASGLGPSMMAVLAVAARA